jgi:predicted RNA-binding protein with PIN domain
MPWLIDGSNVLGGSRLGDDAKRQLLRMLAALARAKRTKITCVFDGVEPASFGRQLGSVTAVFSGARSADDVIAERAASGRGWSVVTSDRALQARVRGRQVAIVSPAALLREIEAAGSVEEGGGEEWEEWFSDPKNRIDF